jgi:hypothetical protein
MGKQAGDGWLESFSAGDENVAVALTQFGMSTSALYEVESLRLLHMLAKRLLCVVLLAGSLAACSTALPSPAQPPIAGCEPVDLSVCSTFVDAAIDAGHAYSCPEEAGPPTDGCSTSAGVPGLWCCS